MKDNYWDHYYIKFFYWVCKYVVVPTCITYAIEYFIFS